MPILDLFESAIKINLVKDSRTLFQSHKFSGTKIASQNRSDHGGRKRARNHSAAEIAELFASAAAKRIASRQRFLGLASDSQENRSDHGTLRSQT